VLLADVHGHSDKSSAAQLDMTVPSFKLLLHGARSRLNKFSGGSCVLLSNSRSASAGAPPSTPACVDAGANRHCLECSARLRESKPHDPAAASGKGDLSGTPRVSGQCNGDTPLALAAVAPGEVLRRGRRLPKQQVLLWRPLPGRDQVLPAGAQACLASHQTAAGPEI